MNFYRFIIPRLNGDEIESNLDHYLTLVKKGVPGFIVFGGEVGKLRAGIRRLQDTAELPLIISSDLEQGLGQQVRGGTLFPPAAALAIAERLSPGLAHKAFRCMALEASYVGINTIFAPVLDVNTNPVNPIIATRAFSEDTDEVSRLGGLMIHTFKENGIVPCGKHFPGHGDTSLDSHLKMPVIDKSIDELEDCELKPFRSAVSAGVPMIMLGHLSAPALDPSDKPASISKRTISFLKNELGFSGIVITDAMNMGGLGSISEEEASLLALESGVDILLHPSDPDRLASELERSGRSFSTNRIDHFRKNVGDRVSEGQAPPFCRDLSSEASRRAVVVKGERKAISNPFVLVISDDEAVSCSPFLDALSNALPKLRHTLITSNNFKSQSVMPVEADIIIAIYSKVRALKGGTASWISDVLKDFEDRAVSGVSFGNPHLLDSLGSDVFKVYAYWDSESAQLEAARKLLI